MRLNWKSRILRLAVIMAVVPALITSVVGAIAVKRFDRQLTAELTYQIDDEIAGLVELYTREGRAELIDAVNDRIRMTETERAPRSLALSDPDGRVLAGNPDALSGTGSEAWLLRDTPLRGGERLSVGRSRLPKDQAVSGLAALFVTATLLSLLLGCAIGAVSAGLFQRRLHAINAVCHAVASGDMDRRVGADPSGDEIAKLSGNIDAMLERIQALDGVRKRVSDRLAHEIRTPLIRLDARLRDAAPDALDADAIAGLRSDLERCDTMLNGLLDISALEAQSGDRSDFEVFDLAQKAADICDFYDALAEEKDQTVVRRLDMDSPVIGDPDQIGRLVANLLDNAIKYTPRGGTITLGTHIAESLVVLTVCDTGPGVPDDIRETIFSPFFRQSGTGEAAGHGLGLALAKAIAGRHRAELTVGPGAEHTGACFRFSLARQPT